MTEEEFHEPLVLGGGHSLLPGDRALIKLPVGHLVAHEMFELAVEVRRGRKPGPRLLVTAALHGNEINGVEVIRRLLGLKMVRLAGDLLLISVVNVPAFQSRSRYLPDRRDLNRLFPGSASGSFGARLARVLSREVAKHCTHAIDLHTGAVNRPNLPQVRFSDEIPGAREMAQAFGTPVMINSPVRKGSFRDVFTSSGKPQLLFEGGEADILEPAPVRMATQGILAVMRQLKMLPPRKQALKRMQSVMCVDTWWERAPRSGLFLPSVDLGKVATKGMILGEIGDPFGSTKATVRASREGVIIGRARNAVIDEGDGLFHIGSTDRLESVMNNIEAAEAELDHRLDHPVFDDSLED